jgi:hypothetical protein
VGGGSIISDRMGEVAIPLQKISNTIKQNLQYLDNPQFEEEVRTSKVKLSRVGKNLEKEDQEF